ncbi:4-hydroxy-tetrahydrodipicolinate reductase [Cryobacterium sp. BB736]|uniref:4-hydroxy-tetrahydrodipicolinate reductase n=1 Tax=Cryobacterium sp. BB736 TaxID=2746963 RepID=UPI00187718CA
MRTKVAVAGASGRMGRYISDVIAAASDFELFARLNSKTPLNEMLGADIVVDVTLPTVSPKVVEFAVENGIRAIVGTSGWSGERITALETRVAEAPDAGVLMVPNFSLGSVLASQFAATAARFFESIEIVEAHHANKIDSPSGTAVRTAELIAEARQFLPTVAPHADQRARGQLVAGIPVHSLRVRGITARQDVIFAGEGELLTISHETLSQDSYEAGILLALRAMRTLRGVTVGLDSLIEPAPTAP